MIKSTMSRKTDHDPMADMPDVSLSEEQGNLVGRIRDEMYAAVEARPNSSPCDVLYGDRHSAAVRLLIAAGFSEKAAESRIIAMINGVVEKTSKKRRQLPPRETPWGDHSPVLQQGRQIHSNQGGPFWSLRNRDTIGSLPERRIREENPSRRTPHP